MRKTLQFLLAVIVGALRGRPVEIPHVRSDAPRAMLTPDGRYMPAIAGGDETPEEKEAREQAEQAKAEEDAAAAEAEAKRAEEERKAAEAKEWEGDVDKEKAERAVRNARAAEKAAKEEADKAKREAAELRKAQETEHETAKREAGEAKLENERLRSTNQRLKIDAAIREAAAEADVPAKKVRRLLKLVDRDDIRVDADGEVDADTAAEAVSDVLEEFPEFKAEPTPGDPPEDPPLEAPGGNPDRKRQSKELTTEQVQKMAAEDPDRFNQLFDEGKIPQAALAGIKS